jgi:hypothetical protein
MTVLVIKESPDAIPNLANDDDHQNDHVDPVRRLA